MIALQSARIAVALLAFGMLAAAPASDDKPAPEPPTTGAPLALTRELESKLASLEREVKRLAEAGQKAESERLAAKVRLLRDRFGDKPPVGDEPELHVVGVHEGALPPGAQRVGQVNPQGSAVVEIHATDRPVVLALCAYNPIKWELRLGKGARLEQVILTGYHEQEIIAPRGTPVEKYTHDGGSRVHFHAYARDNENYPSLVEGLQKLTGLDLLTFQGTYSFKKPIIVGPQNGDWRAQRVLSELLPVHHEATAFERARRLEAVSAVQFRAVHMTGSGRGPFTAALAVFTPGGPLAASAEGLPAHVYHLAIDPKGPTYYGIAGHEVVRIDWETKQTTRLPLDAGLPELSWPGALAFDTKRRRLVLTSRGGPGHMYSFDPAAGKWSLIGEMRHIGVEGFTYSPEEDCFYGMHRGLGEDRKAAVIYQFGPAGGVLRRFPVPADVPTGPYHGGYPQLVAVGRLLALITPSMPDLDFPGMPDQSRCYLLDSETGKVVYWGVSTPHKHTVRLAGEELDRLWRELLKAEPGEADLLMWRMAAGQEQTVRFLRARMPELPAVDGKRVEALIGQLDAGRFADREKAFADLAKIGPGAEIPLRRARAGRASAEVKTRLERLLQQIERDRGEDPELRREQRALRVLGRVGKPAVEYLKELAAGPEGAYRTRQARAALEQIAQR